jgi:hypothetical protein
MLFLACVVVLKGVVAQYAIAENSCENLDEVSLIQRDLVKLKEQERLTGSAIDVGRSVETAKPQKATIAGVQQDSDSTTQITSKQTSFAVDLQLLGLSAQFVQAFTRSSECFCYPGPGTANTALFTMAVTCFLIGAVSLFTSGDTGGNTETQENRKLRRALAFVNVATGFTNLNFVIAIPNAAQGMSKVTGSYTNAGVWVGIYVLGSFVLYPCYRTLAVQRTKQALLLHAMCAGVGNGIMLAACLTGSVWPMYVGRAIAGMEAGVRFSAQNANSYWTAQGPERLEAMFKTQLATATGNALGFVVPLVLELIFLKLLPSAYLVQAFPDEALRREALPLVFLTVFAVVFSLAIVTYFETPEKLEISGGSTKGPQADINGNEVSHVAILFAAVSFTNCTRSLISLAFKSGAMLLLTCDFCIPSVAGVVIFISEIQVVMCRNLVLSLSKYFGDRAKLQRCLEFFGLFSIPFLYRLCGHGALGVALFLAGSAIFFNANQAQAGVMVAIGSEAAIARHSWLSKDALSGYQFIAQMLAFLCGPLFSFFVIDHGWGQNGIAAALMVLMFAQTAVTLKFVRPKEESRVDKLRGMLK